MVRLIPGRERWSPAQILRDTCAIRQLKRGEGIERVLQRLGLSETTWEDAKVKYEKLAKGGI
jgi:hypothetical protein